MISFNEEQREIINLDKCNILVSAAAGSGKTAVLVGRIMRLLTGKYEGDDYTLDRMPAINIDEILVLTFTKAAAGEMRERIAGAIAEALVLDPQNEHLQKQAILIHNAQITTIDSFCLSILKNNFTEIALEPGFRPANEAEMTFLMDEVLDESLEKVLSEKLIPDLTEFFERFENKDNLKKIKKAVMDLYLEAQKAPFVEDFLEEIRAEYDVESKSEFMEKKWFKELFYNITCDIKEACDMAIDLLEQTNSIGPEEYIKYLEQDINLLEELAGYKDFDSLQSRINTGIKWPALRGKTECDEEIKEAFKARRELYKNLIKRITNDYLSQDIELQIKRMRENAKVIHALVDITKIYSENLENEKREANIITFSDMEHLALKILLKKVDGKYIPSQIAKDYRMLYRELMIDEYQDSNYIQEALIHSISGEDEGRYDRFMVGDIKQSIYRFRNANPDLFSFKYESYDPIEGNNRRICLSKNFRSRANVIDSVNAVFERIMDKELGGVAYDSDSKLYFNASFPLDANDLKTEFIIADSSFNLDIKEDELEALIIAKKIRSLVDEFKVTDGDILRPCRYGDIVILLRSNGDFANVLKKTLDACKIPVHITTNSGYFSSKEILTLINFLSVINNPNNDIALFGSLCSLFGGFDENDAAILGILRANSLYESLLMVNELDCLELVAIKDGLTLESIEKIKKKTEKFLEALNYYRKKVPYTPINELIRDILNDYGYVDYMAALPMGEQKKANILMLINKAEGFEADGFKGLFNFCRYIERLRKYETDEGQVMTLDENANLVRIMTMHKSKGLEFPVCILANLNKGFNRQDEKNELIFHNKYGLGMNYVDVEKRAKYSDLKKKFIASKIHEDALSEEMRVLYVAMTRAKEKLIMTASGIDLEKKSYSSEKKLSKNERLLLKSYAEMILAARGENNWENTIDIKSLTYEDVADALLDDAINNMELRDRLLDFIGNREESEYYKDNEKLKELIDDLKERINFTYPYENLKMLYTKTSVSELKMAAIDEALTKGSMEELPKEFIKAHEENEYIPEFAKDIKAEASGTMRGSAYHRVMELIKYGDMNDKLTIKALDEMFVLEIASGKITKEDYDLVDKKKICNFVNSKLGSEMRKLYKSHNLYLEQPFVLGINANRLDESFPSSECVLIQGIIDVFLVYEDHIELLDYKTDRVSSKEDLIERYKTQLEYYAEALERIMEKKVTKKYMYSFSMENLIEIC